ncbi:MAG TPA: nuclear transport factor 2 family protein [Trebonia sp.]
MSTSQPTTRIITRPEDVPALKRLFEDVIIGIWYDIDHGDGSGVSRCFWPDGTLLFSERLVRGRDGIDAAYAARVSRGARLSRHVVSNIHLAGLTEDTARVVSTFRLYAADGHPVAPNTEPLTVEDCVDDFRRTTGGEWLIERRAMVHLFVRPDAVFAVPTTADRDAGTYGAAAPGPAEPAQGLDHSGRP